MVSTTPVNFSSLFPDIQQQQVLAQALMQQGSTPINPNRMAGRYVVPISPMEGLSKIADNMAGTYMARNANQQLAKRLFGDSNPSTAPGQQQPVVPWTDPDTGQTVNPVPMNSAASAGTSAPMGGLAGSLALPGMDRQTLMAAMLTDPQALIQAKLNSLAPTDATKNEMQHSMSRDLANALFQNKLQKDSSIEMQPGNTLLMPNGQGGFNPMVAAQFDKGISGGYDANGRPYVAPVPGAAQAAAQMAGAVKGAESANSIYPGVTVNGREGVPVWGSGVPVGGRGAVTPPNNISTAPQGAPQNQAVQSVPTMPPNAQGGGLNSPQGGPVILGQTPAEKSQGTKQGENAAAANEGYQKQKAAMDAIDATINRLIEINEQVPSGNFGLAHAQAAISNTVSPMFGAQPTAAKAAQEWEQLTGQNILGGLKQLQGMGRVDLPEVGQVIKTYGLGMENSPEVRGQGLQNFRTMLHNNLATSQNTVSGINTPTVPQVPQAQVQPYTNAAQSPGASPAPQMMPPTAAIQMLRQNPGLASHFDQKYGAGMAAKVLGQ